MRYPHPEVLQVLDPRLVLDEGVILAARFGGTGLLVAETLAAGLTYGRRLWFGTPGNVGNQIFSARLPTSSASLCMSPWREPAPLPDDDLDGRDRGARPE